MPEERWILGEWLFTIGFVVIFVFLWIDTKRKYPPTPPPLIQEELCIHGHKYAKVKDSIVPLFEGGQVIQCTQK